MKNVHSKIVIFLCLIFSSSSMYSQTTSVYVSDAGGFNNPPWFIYKFDENGENPEILLNQDDGIIWPEDILFLEDQNAALVTSLSTAGIIGKYNATTWEFIENFAEGIAGPTRMKIGFDNLIYVLQWSNTNNKVLRYQQDGTFVDEFTSVGVAQSIGLDWDASGNLYVSSYGDSNIRKFDTDGNDLGLFISTGLAGPTNIWFDKNGTGDLIVLNWNNGTVKRFDSDGNFIVDILTGLSQPEGVDFFPNGDILIGNGGDGAVKRYDNTFNFIENFIEPGLLITPNAIVIREDPIASVNDFNEQNIISNTIGSTFHLVSNSDIEISTIQIYNAIGKLIETIHPEDSLAWNAIYHAEGLYFIMVSSKEGKRYSQKVIVKK